mgnify:FL=1
MLREFFTFKPQAKNETSASEIPTKQNNKEKVNRGKEIIINISEEGEKEETRVENNSSSSGLTGQATKQFVSQYAYHLLAALLLIILIILVATGAWKRVVEFFVEEENGKKKANKKGRR